MLLEWWRGERYRRRLQERLAQLMGPGWAGSWEEVWSPEVASPAGQPWQEAVERRLIVSGAVERLPPELRAAVLLHYFADLPLAEVARHLGSTSGAIKMRLLRARLALRTLLEAEHGLEDVMATARSAVPARGELVARPAEQAAVHESLSFGMEVGGRRYATAPLSEPAFSGEVPTLDDLRWAVARLHVARQAGPRPLAAQLRFWAAPNAFEHPDPLGVWTLLTEASLAPPDFPLIATDGWRLGTDPDWRPMLEGLQRAGLRHVWLTFAGLGATHDSLSGRPGAFAAAVRALERATAVGLGKGANVIVSSLNAGEVEELVRLVYTFREDPADPRGVSVYVPHWSPLSPAYEKVRPEPEDVAGLPPADAPVLWGRHAFWADPSAFTEAALTRAALEGPAAEVRPGRGPAGGAYGLIVNARMDVLVSIRRDFGPPYARLANLREHTPEQVYAALATLEPPPPRPPDATLAAQYGDPRSRTLYPSLEGLRTKWVHAWQTDQGLPTA